MPRPSERLCGAFGISDIPDALFYEFEYALRFNLSGGVDQNVERVRRFLVALERAREVVRMLFAETGPITAMVTYRTRTANARPRTGRRVLSELANVGVAVNSLGTWDVEREDIDVVRYRHCIEVTHAGAVALLWSNIGRELGIEPIVSADFHLVDFDRRILVHVYDDRGMDVVAMEPSRLLTLYRQFYDRLQEYDLTRMDETFGHLVSSKG